MTHPYKNNTSLCKPNKEMFWVFYFKFCNANAIVHKLGTCKDRREPEYLNFLVFELKLN